MLILMWETCTTAWPLSLQMIQILISPPQRPRRPQVRRQRCRFSKANLIIGAVITFALPFFSFASSQTTENSQARLSLVLENDTFVGTDRYFSNGIELSLEHHSLAVLSPRRLWSASNHREFASYSAGFIHRIYTPTHLSAPNRQRGDHPFSALLSVQHRTTVYNFNRSRKRQFEIQLGITGENALGYELQNGVHWISPKSGLVQGWEHALPTDAVINIYSEWQQKLWRTGLWTIDGMGGIEAGTLFNNVRGGLIFSTPKAFMKTLTLQGQVQATTQWIIYDGSLQGGLIHRWRSGSLPSAALTSAQVNTWVSSLIYGLHIQGGRWAAALQWTHQTPRFAGAGDHAWMSIQLSQHI